MAPFLKKAGDGPLRINQVIKIIDAQEGECNKKRPEENPAGRNGCWIKLVCVSRIPPDIWIRPAKAEGIIVDIGVSPIAEMCFHQVILAQVC